ncbi:hypothetical protein BDZ85DRAFT_321567 [Elsinoe ampelina]|uniref:Uncharacterized protein n=1 Tax=Elsinoe ampelina TaxID=302913 RepID=A0A6A6G2Y4_9PEZI|nr:hypothetical protein BDZ85DRAFT_321567 [Elsinoe ampelina]
MSFFNLQFLLFTVLPFAYPRLMSLYRTLRAPATSLPRPLPPRASLALQLLLLSALGFLLSTLPFFSPANLYALTSSQLSTPTVVLFNRLSALRPPTAVEERLRTVFEAGGREARLLYLKFGPQVLAGCRFVDHRDAGAAWILYAYALPGMLAPHLLHLVVLGVATATGVTGKEGGRWRALAVGTGVVLALAEVGVVGWWEHGWNTENAKLGKLVYLFWRVRLVRGLVVAATDAVLGWVVWLGATGRAFVVPASGAERVEMATREAEATLMKLRALGTMRNVVHRNQVLRGQVERYWVHEGERMRSVVEDRDVVLAMTNVLENTNMEQLMREADQHVNAWVPDVQITEQPAAS